MAIILRQRRSKAARWARRLSALAVVLLLTATLAHRFGYLGTEPYLATTAVVVVIVLLSLLAFAWGFRRMWVHDDHVGADLVLAAIYVAVALSPYAVLAWRGVETPALHDIATDTEDPPRLVPPATVTGWMNPASVITPQQAQEQLEAYPQVTGRRYVIAAARLRELISGLVKERGWTVLEPFIQMPDVDGASIAGIARSFLVGLPSQFAIRVIDEGTSSYVDMRSASLYGRKDFGDNAMRIDRFLTDLDGLVAAEVNAAPSRPAPAQ